MRDIDLSAAQWRKSSRSGGNGGNCVECCFDFLESDSLIYVRDSKDPNGPALRFTRDEFIAFTEGVKNGEFDL
ncbi:uncharacterized protein DUF397 [Krasilnikovia cinnamomea]|uniref:Uncharacterized protein DUF397 n=1 Tax=Krasilnikovia cinnamomea TaxID=349313 RepID=A0A4Q7ZFI8_9ACTN|nr:DUF397 domain-containing protein [Krasilnikovia cinnamomea]RZU49507.1 uncharacterized protein DUF397 [Krasilnikovia cinnamomea]